MATTVSLTSFPCNLRGCEVAKISNKLLINCLWTMWCIFLSPTKYKTIIDWTHHDLLNNFFCLFQNRSWSHDCVSVSLEWCEFAVFISRNSLSHWRWKWGRPSYILHLLLSRSWCWTMGVLSWVGGMSVTVVTLMTQGYEQAKYPDTVACWSLAWDQALQLKKQKAKQA